MKKQRQRPNRMLKTDDPPKIERVEEAKPDPQDEPKQPGYPCKYCQGPTEVTRSFPPFETTQHPVMIVKRRYRKCKICHRSFTSQEETVKDG